jgi:asparagine synthetase B (glutamine-hydrolysing)
MIKSFNFLGGFNIKKPPVKKTGSEMEILTHGDFRFFNNRVEHPLYAAINIDNEYFTGFVHGIFYDKPMIPYTFKGFQLASILNNLNGSFNGFLLNKKDNTILLFTDILGFDKIYVKRKGNLTISSSIWPLAKGEEINSDALTEHLTLGHSLHGKTLFKNVETIYPGYIYTYCKKGELKGKQNYYKLSEGLTSSPNISQFAELVKQQQNYINSKNLPENIGMTLTGGNDTRVILNSLLRNSILPSCFVGFHTPGSTDHLRAEKIADHYKLPFYSLNYSYGFKEIIEEVVESSNGYTNGIWMGNLSKLAARHADLMYYGFSGDLLSGGNEFNFSRMNIDQIVETSLHYKTYYKQLNYKHIAALTGTDSQNFYEAYHATYNQYRDEKIDDAYFLQEKNERNHRRIASFADGTRLGPDFIYFYHDRRIIDFYKSMKKSQLNHQAMHHKLSFYKNKFLAWMPSANKTELPSFLIPYISRLVNEKMLRAITKYKATPVFESVNCKEDLINFICSDYEELKESKLWQMIDLDLLLKEHGGRFVIGDINGLKMRLWDAMISLRILEKY